MSNGQRKQQKTILARKHKQEHGKGCWIAPADAQRVAITGLATASTMMIGWGTFPVFLAKRIAEGRPLTTKQLRRMLVLFDRHQWDRDNKFGQPDEETPGSVAWMLRGGDPAAAWVRSLRAKLEP
jgi:hypothetical protein